MYKRQVPGEGGDGRGFGGDGLEDPAQELTEGQGPGPVLVLGASPRVVAGAILVAAAMDLGGFDELTVSDRGVRWGLLHDRFGSGAGGA